METTKHGDYTIEIERDEFPYDPREDDNLGTMVCFHRRYNLGDKHAYRKDDFSSRDDLAAQIQRDTGGAIIMSTRLYDHSEIGVTADPSSFGTYPWNCPWDSMWVGLIYMSHADIRSEYGVKRITKELAAKVKEALIAEVAIYNQYLTGEVYAYAVKDRTGNVVDSCCGFYDLEYCKEQAIHFADYVTVRNETGVLPL